MPKNNNNNFSITGFYNPCIFPSLRKFIEIEIFFNVVEYINQFFIKNNRFPGLNEIYLNTRITKESFNMIVLAGLHLITLTNLTLRKYLNPYDSNLKGTNKNPYIGLCILVLYYQLNSNILDKLDFYIWIDSFKSGIMPNSKYAFYFKEVVKYIILNRKKLLSLDEICNLVSKDLKDRNLPSTFYNIGYHNFNYSISQFIKKSNISSVRFNSVANFIYATSCNIEINYLRNRNKEIFSYLLKQSISPKENGFVLMFELIKYFENHDLDINEDNLLISINSIANTHNLTPFKVKRFMCHSLKISSKTNDGIILKYLQDYFASK